MSDIISGYLRVTSSDWQSDLGSRNSDSSLLLNKQHNGRAELNNFNSRDKFRSSHSLYLSGTDLIINSVRMLPDSPAKEKKTLPLSEWIEFQFKEIIASADILKDACETFKKRKLDCVLSDLETKALSTNKFTTSIVRDCNRIIAQHVQTLLNIDEEMRHEFSARFPSEGRKIKYKSITVPSFCTIRSSTPETDPISSPEKENSTFRKRKDVSDSEVNTPTKVDRNTSERRTRQKLNLSSDEDMFGELNENNLNSPLEFNENSPEINITPNQSEKSTPTKNKSSDSAISSEDGKVESPDKNTTMKTREESDNDMYKKTRDNSADAIVSVRGGRQLRQRTTIRPPSPPKVGKRESRTRSAKTLQSQPDVKVKLESLEHKNKHAKQIEETLSSNAVTNATVKDENSESDDDESKPSRSYKKNRMNKDEKKMKAAVLDESESDVSSIYDEYLEGKLPGSYRIPLYRLHPLIIEELETSGVIRLGRSVKGDDKDELNAALKTLCAFKSIVSTYDSRKKKLGRKRMSKSKRIEAESTDSDDTSKETTSKKKVTLKPINEESGNDTANDSGEDVLSDKSNEGHRKNVLDDLDSAKTKSKSKNREGKLGSYKNQVADDSEDSDPPIKRRTRNTTVKLKSEGSSSEDFIKTKRVLRDRYAKRSESSEVSSEEESSGEFKRSKRRKRRSKKKATSFSEGSDEEYKAKSVKKERRRIQADSSEEESKDESPTKTPENAKGRKNIRAVIRDKHLEKSTRQAGQDEEDRKKRVAEKQRLFNELFQAPVAAAADMELKQLVLDFEPDTKEPILSVDEEIVKKLKPHQADGIRFMWNACFESVSKKGPGDGCILAHCMGLGKTLQTIGFVHTILTNDKLLNLRTALVICPLNTVGNWYNEFKMWLENCDRRVNVHKLWESKPRERTKALEDWKRLGGVGIIHYDAFRLLVNGEDKKGKQRPKPKELEIIRETLIDPGADIVICDEGHLLKNPQSQQSKSVNKVATRRRIVLTGTPLQNNLLEYHTMMQFVKPSLLGSRKEFSNRFVNPILNGQHKDSGERDVQVMKRRAHVLHKLLDGCVQRLDYTVLTPYLPPKYEYAITVNLTDIQKKLYQHYIENLSGNRKGDNFVSVRLFSDYQALVKVWTHPKVLTRKSKAKDKDCSDSENSLKDFIVDKSTTEEESETEESTRERGSASGSDSDWSAKNRKLKKKKRKTRAGKMAGIKEEDNEVKIEEQVKTETAKEDPQTKNTTWYQSFLDTLEDPNAVEHSGKLLVLMEILKTCEGIGDKVLVFSQFLSSLDLVEDILAEIDEESCKMDSENLRFPALENQPAIGRWRPGIEYFRIDGSTKTDERQRSCDTFNQETASKAKLFLISTRAGGLGINLVGANRVVIFDASWNPSQDLQSIFRVFRFGQVKPCYVYRLLARGTMEEKIYNRQVVKLSLSCRVVDEQQIERHFHFDEIQQMYDYDANDTTERPIPIVPKDRLLADLLISQEKLIFSYLEHDSLLENKHDEELTEEERKAAWEEYNNINEQKQKTTIQMQRSYSTEVNMMQDPWIQQTARHFRVLYPGRSDLEYLLTARQSKKDVQEMVNQWDFIHNEKMTDILKVQYRAKFDQLFAMLSVQFGPQANWDTVLKVFPPQKTNPTSYLYARPVKFTNLQPPQNFQLTRVPKMVSISSNMSKIANNMVTSSSKSPGLSTQPTATPRSSQKTYPPATATIVPSKSIFEENVSPVVERTKPSLLRTKLTSYIPPEVISIDN